MDYEEIEYEIEGIGIVMLNFSANFEAEDVGIGPYEYWGARCRDVHWVNTCTEVYDIYAIDENGDDIFDVLDKSVKARIESFCEEYANEHAPDVE